jgi:hypothetical protein
MAPGVGTVIAQTTIALRTTKDVLKRAKASLENTYPLKKATVEDEALKALSRIVRVGPGEGRQEMS